MGFLCGFGLNKGGRVCTQADVALFLMVFGFLGCVLVGFSLLLGGFGWMWLLRGRVARCIPFWGGCRWVCPFSGWVWVVLAIFWVGVGGCDLFRVGVAFFLVGVAFF